MNLDIDKRKELIEAALGKRELDLLIKNAELVNVFTGEIYKADVGIYREFIAHVEADADNIKDEKIEMEAREVIDAEGMYLIPGLIDSHVHIESSMMTPRNFARTVIPHGTTTVITDPHEIGNVMGLEGVKYMSESSTDLPMNQYILAPSCVPSAPDFESSGASFGAEEISEMLEWNNVLGLAEVMDYPGVIHGSNRMHKIIQTAEDKGGFIQGHSPALEGRELSAYLCAGPSSDHEIRVTQEAREKLRMGMTVDARESSISQNLSELIPALDDIHCPPNFTLCTDDRESADLLNEGHMNHVVRRAIEEGLEPWQAIRYATLNSARSIGLKRLGAIAPGYIADMVLLSSLKNMEADKVFYRGKLAAEKGEMTAEIKDKKYHLENINTVKLEKLKAADFKIKAGENKNSISANVISYISKDSLFSDFIKMDIKIENSYLTIKGRDDINYAAVFNRYDGNNDRCVGLINNFGLKKGAVASTVSHDCHNLTVVAANEEDAALAANTLIESGGGIVCTNNGKVTAHLKLPIGGLMSPLPAEKLSIEIEKTKKELLKLGMQNEYPLLKIATLTLAVIPKAKITDKGLLAVDEQKLIKLFQ
ncbi:MAG: adenine deaminase [Bacillota bacterium]